MEITGIDNVIFSPLPPLSVFDPFLDLIKSRWPDPLILEDKRIGGEQYELMVARDDRMSEWWADNGYLPNEEGEGGIYLIGTPFPTLDFEITINRRFQPNQEVLEQDTGRLVARNFWEYTLVLPAAPTKSEFASFFFAGLVNILTR
jgi:hypothetical protein